MQTHAKGPGAGWWWLIRGFTVLGRKPGTILGAAALLGVCMLVLSSAQMLVPLHGNAKLAVVGVSMLIGAMLYPVLYGGFMRVIDAIRHDRPANAFMLFEPFKPGQGGARLALFGFGMWVIYAAFIALLASTVGRAMWTWYLDFLAHQPPLGTPVTSLPPLPSGFAVTLALVTVFFLFYSGAMAVGIGQASLRSASPVAAIKDGVAGAFKNVLPLVVLAICAILAILVVAVVIGIVGAILLGILAFLSKSLAVVVFVIVYVVMIVFMFAIIMGINYAMWHDVADGGNRTLEPPMADTAA
ncbi:MAG TPA: hypothetical protein VFL63_13195 [Rhodanobacteraceae bacterium]|nr:hypothetical protein [Rhodanobacteraceae bacterium]